MHFQILPAPQSSPSSLGRREQKGKPWEVGGPAKEIGASGGFEGDANSVLHREEQMSRQALGQWPSGLSASPVTGYFWAKAMVTLGSRRS